MRMLLVPRTPKAQVVGHSSLCARHGSRNGHGTAQEIARLNGGAVSVLFLLHYDAHRVGATFHFLVYRVERSGRRRRGALAPGGVSLHHYSPHMSSPSSPGWVIPTLPGNSTHFLFYITSILADRGFTIPA